MNFFSMFSPSDMTVSPFPSFGGQMNFSFANGSFSPQDINCNENSFQNASQLIDIDLIDYHEFSNDDHQFQSNNLSLIGSYFGKKSSSLEKLNFTEASKQKLSLLIGNCVDNRCQDDQQIHIGESLVVTKPHFNQPLSVHFNIARYSKFEFDFLNFHNPSNCEVILYFKFVAGKMFPLEIQKKKLVLSPKSTQRANVAYLNPLESGKYCIRLYCFPLLRKSSGVISKITSLILVNCHLNIIDLTVSRTLHSMGTNGPNLIELDCFECVQCAPQQRDLFFQMSKHHLDRPFMLKLCLESDSSDLIAFVDNHQAATNKDARSSAIAYHITSARSCLVSFLRTSHFNIRIQISNKSKEESIDAAHLLSIYACDSLNKDHHKIFPLCDYQIKLHWHKQTKLEHPCIQVTLSEQHNEIVVDKWKRIDLRNKNPSQVVQVNIRLVACGEIEVDPSNWRCTRTRFTIGPLEKEAIFLCVHKSVIADSSLRYLELFIDQFGGAGQQLTSTLRLKISH